MKRNRFRVVLILVVSVLFLSLTQVPAAPALAAGETVVGETGSGISGEGRTYKVAKVTEDWTMWDGITIPVSVYYPEDAPAGERFPAIIFVHGWTLDKSMGEWGAEYFASRGYVGVAITARGWFGAGGDVGCMDPEHEMKDVSHVITLLGEDPRFPVLEDEKGPVVGITGASMGGCFSYLKSERKDPRPGDPGDPRIRAAVPMHGSFDLTFSLLPNGAGKMLWGALLVGVTYLGDLSGFMVSLMNLALDSRMDGMQKLQTFLGYLWKLMPPVTTFDPGMLFILGTMLERRTEDYGFCHQYFKVRSARYWCDEEYDGSVEHPIITPTLILAGWNDDLFFANEGLMAFSHIQAPKRIIITNHGHLGCYPGPFPVEGITGSPESAWVRQEVERWFDRFLKGVDNGADREPPVVFYRHTDPSRFGTASTYPLPGTREVSWYLGGAGPDGLGTLSRKVPATGDKWDLLVNIGLTGSISLPYYQDAPELLGGEALGIPTRIKLLEIPFTETSYLSRPLKRDLTVMGAPRFQFFYRASGEFTQLIPWLYEVTPEGEEILVSRGFYEGYGYTPWTDTGMGNPLEMQACYHRFRAGSRIKLVVSTADLLSCWPNWGLNFIFLLRSREMPSRIVLPIVPPGT
ncbi:MAG: CocE/NonD family hydrolase [Actinobacteria bacterium]|nr:CocE/NonD family hydrolase [Actinomycetota bacterium]